MDYLGLAIIVVLGMGTGWLAGRNAPGGRRKPDRQGERHQDTPQLSTGLDGDLDVRMAKLESAWLLMRNEWQDTRDKLDHLYDRTRKRLAEQPVALPDTDSVWDHLPVRSSESPVPPKMQAFHDHLKR